MARRAKSKRTPRAAATSNSGRPTIERDAIVAAFVKLLAEEPFERIGFADIAEGAGVSLAELRGKYPSKMAILAAHMTAVDREVLAEADPEMTEEPPRERLFDVLMRRIEILDREREAVRSLLHSARINPGFACAINGLAVRSMYWMLTAAGISASGPRGMIRAQGLAVLYARVLRTFVEDDDPGHARTMAALDRALARGQRWSGFLDDLLAIPSRVCGTRSRRRRNASEDPIAA